MSDLEDTSGERAVKQMLYMQKIARFNPSHIQLKGSGLESAEKTLAPREPQPTKWKRVAYMDHLV